MRFFYPNLSTQGPYLGMHIELTDGIYQHWVKVLRARVGDGAILFDGTGGEWNAVLTHIDKKSAQVVLGAFNPINRELGVKVILAQAVSKPERMDYAIAKACEMGVSVIVPIISDYSLPANRAQKQAHWQKIAISACEQCGLNIVPIIKDAVAFTDFVAQDTSCHKIVLDPNGQKNLPSLQVGDSISLLVGAEGGLSERERDLAYQHGYHGLYLGTRILRTETAPIVAMALIDNALIGA